MKPITFGEAVNKWQIKLGLDTKSLLDKRMMINQQINLSKKKIKIREIFTDTFCLREWDSRKRDEAVNSALTVLYKIADFEQFINEFINTLFLHRVPCYLDDPDEKFKYQSFPHVIFSIHKRQIIESCGYVNINDKTYLISFNEEIFDDFLDEVTKNYRMIFTDLLARGTHTPEGRSLKQALKELNNEQIKALHTQGDENDNKKTDLAKKLQEWEPDLNDKWAMNNAILLKKFAE